MVLLMASEGQQLMVQSRLAIAPNKQSWKPPEDEWLKINIDGDFLKE